jgi:hypothetical protein
MQRFKWATSRGILPSLSHTRTFIETLHCDLHLWTRPVALKRFTFSVHIIIVLYLGTKQKLVSGDRKL